MTRVESNSIVSNQPQNKHTRMEKKMTDAVWKSNWSIGEEYGHKERPKETQNMETQQTECIYPIAKKNTQIHF